MSYGKKIKIKQVDVFTNQPLAGNPLAVVLNAEGLSDEDMQRIAREMNLSETTFILPPKDPNANYKMRIFTPAGEIPFAGHPSIGTAFALAEEGRFPLKEPFIRIYQEVGIGVLPIDIYVKDHSIQRIVMTQGKPQFGLMFQDNNPIAKSLRIDPKEISSTNLSPQIVSTGLKQLIIPIKSLKTVSNLDPDFSAIRKLEGKFGFLGCSVFTRETLSSKAFVHVWFFAPSGGVLEDPATGSAAGGLGAYLLKWKILSTDFNPSTFVIEQGIKIQRPSTIYVEVEHQNGYPINVKVGGEAVTVLEGEMIL